MDHGAILDRAGAGIQIYQLGSRAELKAELKAGHTYTS